ncbi:MAG: AbrB family transcriptional regulator [Anaerolineae bacterium]|nr:AbrB family transcriptional regulator [Anaerolineae bacterium]
MSLRRWGLSRRVALGLVVGLVGMLAARWTRFPGGGLTGALLLTGALRLANGPIEAPPGWMKALARICLGLAIGVQVTPETVEAIGRAMLPVLFMITVMMALGLLLARVIRRATDMPLVTALCSSSPGGLSAMVALADDLGGEGAVVASMHLVRYISVQLVVPLLVRARFPAAEGAAVALAGPGAAPAAALLRIILLTTIGLLVGFGAERLRLPAGGMLGGMLAAAVFNPLWLRLPGLPGAYSLVAQLVIGVGVGATLTRAALHDFKPYALSGILMTACLILMALGLGWVLAQVSSLDLVTAIVGSAPGGADTMVLLASDLDADPQLVAAMHLSRLILIMLAMPFLIRVSSQRSVPQAEAAG